MTQHGQMGRVLVCGGTRGLGLACAEELAARGYRVAVLARDGGMAQNIAQRIGGGAIGLGADLSDMDALDTALTMLLDRWGGIDVVVLNSGGPSPVGVLQMSEESLLEAERLILLPALRIIRRTVPLMCEQNWGRVIAIGSSGVIQPIPGLATSNIVRAALAAMLKTLAKEVAAHGVTVNMVIPGRFATDRVNSLDNLRASKDGVTVDTVRSQSVSEIPIGRYGDPRELAEAVAFLASKGASYVTGSLLRVDGGLIGAIN